jgi:hypothetical protein
MAERIAAKLERRRLAREAAARRKRAQPCPKPNGGLAKHFTEVMERLIDDLGLDVPRREHKQLTA